MSMKTFQTDAIVRLDLNSRSKNKKQAIENLSPFDAAAWCCLCEHAYKHTLLIDQISEQIKQNPDLINWIRAVQDVQIQAAATPGSDAEGKSWLPEGLVTELCNRIKTTSEFKNMSGRARTSATERTEEIYKSWFASRLKLIMQIRGKRRWLTVVESDAELAENSNFSQLAIESQAEQILGKIEAKNELASSSDDNNRRLFSSLFDAFDATEDVLERRAIVHLLKNGGKVRVEPKQPRRRKNQQEPTQPMTLEERLAAKQVEIDRLEKQLLSQLPRARNLFPDWAFEEALENLVALPDPDPLQASETEAKLIEDQFYDWHESITAKLSEFLKEPKSLPYPISFGYEDVRAWQVNHAGKIFFKLNGWGDLIFEVRCDRRQLPLIKTFLKDWQTKEQSDNENQYSGSFMLLRSIELIWKPKKTHEQSDAQLCSECEVFQQYSGKGFWNECKLSIHWTYDSDGLTRQGLEKIRQQKLESQLESLKKKQEDLEKKQKLVSRLEKVPADSRSEAQSNRIEKLKQKIQDLQVDLAKPRPKLVCLQNSPLFDRPDRPPYEGVPNIFVGVLLDLDKHLVITVVDAMRRKVLAIRNAQSVSKEGYSLLQKYFREREEHSKQRQEDQKAHRHQYQTESELGQQVARLFAKGIVELAQQYKASTIVLPETDGWRDRLYSQLVARAKIKCNGSKKAMARYTKAHGEKLHQWDYNRLSQAIVDRATTDGLKVMRQRTVYEEDAFQQAANLAIAAYDSLNSDGT